MFNLNKSVYQLNSNVLLKNVFLLIKLISKQNAKLYRYNIVILVEYLDLYL